MNRDYGNRARGIKMQGLKKKILKQKVNGWCLDLPPPKEKGG